MEERGHVIYVLKQVLIALNKKDYITIKNLSNQTLHTSSISQDEESISIAVIIYSLSKILERDKYKNFAGWNNFYKKYITGIKNSIKALENNNEQEFHKEIHRLRNIIQNITGNLKQYIQDVFRKAEINKASRIYEHGISMEKTAKMLGISIWELAEYTGQKLPDTNLTITLPVKKRIEYVEEIFK